MKPTTVTAFCPGHISGYFRRIEGDSPATTGSIGAGIVISEGVTATVCPSVRPSVRVKKRVAAGSCIDLAYRSPPISDILERLDVSASVTTECRLPIGAGFGLSAAALLATLTALNRLFCLDLTAHDIALCAHETEVAYRTGLGDVAACQDGGRVLRKGPGIDAEIERRFDLAEPVYAVSFGPITTPSVLGSPEQMERVSAAYPMTFPADLDDFFSLSKQFARKSGLLTPEVLRVLDICNKKNVPASMTMLGNGVFAYGKRARAVLMPFGEVFGCRMAGTGAYIVEEHDDTR